MQITPAVVGNARLTVTKPRERVYGMYQRDVRTQHGTFVPYNHIVASSEPEARAIGALAREPKANQALHDGPRSG